METADVKKKTVDELHALATELRSTLRTIRFGSAGSRARDVKQAKTVRRGIARIETELRMRSLAGKGK